MAKGPKDQAVSERLPVARVAVDISLAHLDRPFDYLVPASWTRRPCRVPGPGAVRRPAGRRLRAGARADERAPGQAGPARAGDLAEPVLTPEISTWPGRSPTGTRARWPTCSGWPSRRGTRPRNARPRRPDAPADAAAPRPPEPGSWARYPAGGAFLAGLADGRPVRAAWSALPGPHWPAEIAIAAATTAAAGRGVVIVVPDARDLDRVDAALTAVSPGDHVCLTADLGPAERYRRWLAVRRGLVRVVAGTRAAMFAPVTELGLVVLWDDGDDLHAEPRAPYPNAREVLALRAHRSRAAALIGGFARTAELTQLVAAGWARPLTGGPEACGRRRRCIRAAPDEAELARDAAAMTARLPSLALRSARSALAGDARGGLGRSGPGPGAAARLSSRGCLRPVPGSGQVRHLRRPAGDRRRRTGCLTAGGAGPWRRTGPARAAGRPPARAGHRRGRTAEELGRAFPGVPVRTSGGQHVLATVPAEPALVIATPGAEPVAPEGYAGALLLDGWALLGRPSLRAGEEALRRWLNAAALVRPGRTGGGPGRGVAARGAGADPLGSGDFCRTRAG